MATLGDYFVEYTTSVELDRPVTVCEDSCQMSSYSKKTEWKHFNSIEEAFEWINHGNTLHCGLCSGDTRPKGFEFVKLLKTETLQTTFGKVGEYKTWVHEPKEITKDIKEWKLL